MAQNLRTAGYVRLTGIVETAEEGGFVSLCPELGIASQGESIEEALANLGEAIDAHLESLVSLGELDRVLQEKRIEVLRKIPRDAVSVSVTPGTVVSPLVAAL